MGIRSRRKGARVENEIVHRLQEHGIAATKRSRMYLSGHDLDMPIVPGDWGSAAPFAVLWLAVAGDDYADSLRRNCTSRRACLLSRMVRRQRSKCWIEIALRGSREGHYRARGRKD